MFNINKLLVMSLMLSLAVFAGPAMATTGGGGFDTSGILADIALYIAGAIALVGAYIAGRWSKKALALLNPGS